MGGWADVIIKELDIQPDDNVADVGAGTGAVTEIIWNRVGEGTSNNNYFVCN